MMYLGTLEARLFLRESRTLKDKRQVVRSILDRLRGRFSLAAAEVDTLDDVRIATLGFAAVGPEAAGVQAVLQAVTEALRTHPVAEYLGGRPTVAGHHSE